MKLGVDANDNETIFIVERLGRGSVINHRSFLPKVDDEADTDYKCITPVSAFIIKTSAVEKILARK